MKIKVEIIRKFENREYVRYKVEDILKKQGRTW
jgi:hypothetical protein